MADNELVPCACCAGNVGFIDTDHCFFCADGSNARPQVHSKALHVECMLLGPQRLTAGRVLCLRRSHGLAHADVDAELTRMESKGD